MAVNFLAVLVAAIVSMVIGAVWYSPLVFGKIWMKLSGVMPKGGAVKSYLIGGISTLVTSYVLAHFIHFAEATTVVQGITAGFWLWLGFIATTTLSSVIWEGKPVKLYILNNAYSLVSLIVMGAILSVWQ